jgi:hypothetical protein
MTEVDRPYIRQSYPGLRDEEARLLRGYLEDTSTEDISRLRTQVRVGEGEIITGVPDEFATLANDLSKLKIDVVVDRLETTEIVELKSRLRNSFIGQLVTYSNLLGADPEERSTFRLVGVGFRAHPDIRDGTAGTGVRIHLVPRADRTIASRTPINSPFDSR